MLAARWRYEYEYVCMLTPQRKKVPCAFFMLLVITCLRLGLGDSTHHPSGQWQDLILQPRTPVPLPV